MLSVVFLCSYSPSLVFLLQGRAGDETRTINGEERQQDDLNDDEVDDDNNILLTTTDDEDDFCFCFKE